MVNSRVAGQFKILSIMRKKFDKSLKIDKETRNSLVSRIERITVGGEGARAAEAQFHELFKEREGSLEAKIGLESAKSRIHVEKSGSTIWGHTR